MFLREPTLICQQIATLDELTGGRAECVISTGNFGLLAQYHIDWAGQKPLSRLRRRIHVMRTFLDEGAINFEGDFFKYTGLFTFARPVQERIPLLMGGDAGPALVPRRRASSPTACTTRCPTRARPTTTWSSNVRDRRRARPGATLGRLDIGAWVVTVVSEDSAAAKDAARILVAFYISSMPAEQLARHGIDAGRARSRSSRRSARATSPRRVELFTPEFAEKLSVAGTPEEVVEKIKADIQPAGVNHMIFALTDASLVKLFSGEDVPNVPDIHGQLRLVAERVMPAFEPAVRRSPVRRHPD